VKFLLLFFVYLFFLSCSFKPNENSFSQEKESTELSIDSDGDGLSDSNELKHGTDPLIADLPKINGNYFNQFSIDIDFYNKSLNKFENTKWSFENNKLKLGWTDLEYESTQGSIYMESLLKHSALAYDFKKTHLRIYDFNESVTSFSSPTINEDALINISEKVLELTRDDFTPFSLEAIIQSKFNVQSEKFKSFRKPLFDIYYKSNKQEALKYLDSKELDGTYTFNDEHEIFIDYQSRNPEIIFDAIINGGAKFFLKLRDFTIYETGEKYTEIIKRVQKKSVPITISFFEDDGKSQARVETMYIGLNGANSNLYQIIKTAFKDNILISDGGIDGIEGFFNRERSMSEIGQNESLKWFIGAEFVNENIFEHEFRPNEGIGLAYFSNKRSDSTPLYLSRAILSPDKMANSGKLPLKTSNSKIRIIPKNIQIPVAKKKQIIRGDCGNGRWDVNEVRYNQTFLEWSNRTYDYYEHMFNDIHLKIYNIQGTILDGNLSNLVKRNFLRSKKLQSGEVELEFWDSIRKSLLNTDLQISIELSIIPTPKFINDGELEFISKKCNRYISDPPRGGINGRNEWYFKSSHIEQYGIGFSEKSLFPNYDLNIHFIAY
jgi:hypothetical protein